MMTSQPVHFVTVRIILYQYSEKVTMTTISRTTLPTSVLEMDAKRYKIMTAG